MKEGRSLREEVFMRTVARYNNFLDQVALRALINEKTREERSQIRAINQRIRFLQHRIWEVKDVKQLQLIKKEIGELSLKVEELRARAKTKTQEERKELRELNNKIRELDKEITRILIESGAIKPTDRQKVGLIKLKLVK